MQSNGSGNEDRHDTFTVTRNSHAIIRMEKSVI